MSSISGLTGQFDLVALYVQPSLGPNCYVKYCCVDLSHTHILSFLCQCVFTCMSVSQHL